MGLDSVWREIKERDFVESHKELKLITPRKIQNPINRLKGNLRWNFIFGIIGIIAFSAIVISYSALSIRIYNWSASYTDKLLCSMNRLIKSLFSTFSRSLNKVFQA